MVYVINYDNKPLKPIPKFNKMKRIQARKSWLVMSDFIR